MGIALNKRKNLVNSAHCSKGAGALDKAAVEQIKAALIALENESLRQGLVDAAIFIEQAVHSIDREVRIDSWAALMGSQSKPLKDMPAN